MTQVIRPRDRRWATRDKRQAGLQSRDNREIVGAHPGCFLRAAVADRAVGSWLAGISNESTAAPTRGTAHGQDGDLPALRALACAASTSYARRLRADGIAPEQMLVLVRSATANHGLLGFGTQELTSDIVRWSIDACFDERSDKPAQPRPG